MNGLLELSLAFCWFLFDNTDPKAVQYQPCLKKHVLFTMSWRSTTFPKIPKCNTNVSKLAELAVTMETFFAPTKVMSASELLLLWSDRFRCVYSSVIECFLFLTGWKEVIGKESLIDSSSCCFPLFWNMNEVNECKIHLQNQSCSTNGGHCWAGTNTSLCLPLSNFMIDFAQGQSSSRGCVIFCCYTTNAVQPSALWSRRSRQTLFSSSLLILQYFPSKCFFLLLDHSALSFVNWWIKAGSLYTSTVWIAKQELTLTPLE